MIEAQMKNASPTPLLVSPNEAAQLLGISTRSLYRLLSAGRLGNIQPVKVGGSTRFRFGELTRWIEAGCPEGSS